jgi:hypothetical protein
MPHQGQAALAEPNGLYYEVSRAITRGSLIVRGYCQLCGKQTSDGWKTMFHHDDYVIPFRVMELCYPCHSRIMKTNKEIERKARLKARGKLILARINALRYNAK